MITKSVLALMLIHHRRYYIQDELLPEEEGRSADYAEEILKKVFVNLYRLKREEFGDTYLKAYGVIDDHTQHTISTKTAIRKLLELLNHS